ncbi:MAG TPA: amino acid adenylation domain-containing protein [Longimicrobiaceae bacterium]|nr:amino acid adenylation domain-containing protein [Longimicrobiaceae bacterium]
MSDLSSRISELSPEKLALLMQRMKAARPAAAASSIPRRERPADPSPPSFAQQRLWLIDQLEPGGFAYNVLAVLRFDGELDVGALQHAVDELVRRHEALRTVFRLEGDRPVQVIAPELRIDLPVEELDGVPDPEAATRERAGEEARRPFDLAEGPLLRTRLLRFGPGSHVLLATMHHIVSDGWSRGVMIRELSALYDAALRGEPASLPELPIQYADFAAWQRERLEGPSAAAQVEYWRKHLEGAPAALELPTDSPRPPVQTFPGARFRFTVPGPTADGLRALAQREQATVFMVLLAAFKVLLQRYSGQEDIVVGSPVANRNRVETEGLIGFFANTLALRTRLADDPSFLALLRRVRETVLGAFEHQEVPFEKVVEAVKPERDPSRLPVFQVMFLVDNTPLEPQHLKGVRLQPVGMDAGISSFDLTLEMEDAGGGLHGVIEYNTDLFREATIRRMAACYRTLLESVHADPSIPLSGLRIVSEEERTLQLAAWNPPTGAAPAEEPVHELFAAQARRTPGAPAVVAQDEEGEVAATLTYAELNSRANRLAHLLRRRGVGAETRVAVCLDRSPEMLVAILGVLKAGGAYVPLDPGHPAERYRFVLADSGAVLAVTRTALEAPLRDLVPTVCLDGGDSPLAGESDGDPAPAVHPESAAYVIYTSGSTGTPKGVLVEHRALASYTRAAAARYGIGAADRVLQFSSLTFDASVEEIFPTLTRGAALVLRTEGMAGTDTVFLELCRAREVTVASLPTAFWHELAAAPADRHAALPPSLRLVILGGERVIPERLARWHDRVGGAVALLNTYGPTEATVVATAADLTAPGAPDGPQGEASIGTPLDNARAYVLDPRGELLPASVPGELYVGGAGLARGYLGRPELTAERFLPDPFGAEPGARMYRTGDLARWRDGGELEFAGRVDDQVKIRGFRVETGEVEAVLAACPRVRQAAVVAREDAPGARRLVAYVVPADAGAPPEARELHAWLRERLPEYMVPSAFVALDAVPLTPAGKLDRRALPAPERDHASVGGAFVAPRNAVEEVLAGVWQEVLGLERVGVHDSLFDLGGHSLSATRVVAQVREIFQVQFPVRVLFESPTIARMAELLLEDPARRSGVERVATLVLELSSLSDEEVDVRLAGPEPAPR